MSPSNAPNVNYYYLLHWEKCCLLRLPYIVFQGGPFSIEECARTQSPENAWKRPCKAIFHLWFPE